MNLNFDKRITHIAYLYILLPFIIFCFGWLRWYLAVGMLVVLGISYILCFRKYLGFQPIDLKKERSKLWISLLVICIIVFFSGIGCYAYQVEDFDYRNAVLHDLITHPWPFFVNTHANISFLSHPVLYIYYCTFWLPSALVGKMFGWQAANFFLYLWASLGVSLNFYFLCRHLGRFSLKLLFIYLFLNGLYIWVSFFKFPITDVLTNDYKVWSGDLLLDSSSAINCIFWIHNQTIVPTLIVLLLLNNAPKANSVFLYALCYLHGPFMFIGFFPFFLLQTTRHIFTKSTDNRSFLSRFLEYLSFQNVVGALSVLLVSYFYLSGSSAVQSLFVKHIGIKMYVLFAFVSFGLLALILWKRYFKNPEFYVAAAMLAILPFIGMGNIQPFTFCTRVSLVPMLIFMLLAARLYFESSTPVIWKRMLAAYFLLASLEPALELSRSVVLTVGYYANPVAVNNYLLHRKCDFNVRNSMLPQSGDLTKDNYLVLTFENTLDSQSNRYIQYYQNQSSETIFTKYFLKK